MTSDPERSRLLRVLKARDTALEMIVRPLVDFMDFRHRLHRNDLLGKPDLTFQNCPKVIFVHGCFWHGHDCKHGVWIAKATRDDWERKIASNRKRHEQHYNNLNLAGWGVLLIWECQLKEKRGYGQWSVII